MKAIRFALVASTALLLGACAYHPRQVIPPGNSAYGHAQGNGPKFKKSHITVYGDVDAGYGYKKVKVKHHKK